MQNADIGIILRICAVIFRTYYALFLYFTVLCAKSIPDFQCDLDFALRIHVEERFVIVDDNAISLIPYSRHKAELQ